MIAGRVRSFRLDEPPFAGRTGRGVRVAVIDSGIHAPHPHVPSVRGGASVTVDPASDSIRVHAGEFDDRLGHGTAVAAAIHEKAPDVELWAVKVFDRSLTTSAAALARGIEYAAESGARLINLSLGTDNASHAAELEGATQRAGQRGALVIAPLESRSGQPCFPGSFPGAVGVRYDPECPRDEIRIGAGPGIVLVGSPFPRPIPGVPPERNLHGVSFAVANVTGFVARLVEHATQAGRDDVFRLLASI